MPATSENELWNAIIGVVAARVEKAIDDHMQSGWHGEPGISLGHSTAVEDADRRLSDAINVFSNATRIPRLVQLPKYVSGMRDGVVFVNPMQVTDISDLSGGTCVVCTATNQHHHIRLSAYEARRRLLEEEK